MPPDSPNYRFASVISNTVNSNLILIRTFSIQFAARLLSFNVEDKWSIRVPLNLKENLANEWPRISRVQPVYDIYIILEKISVIQ